MKCFVLVLTFNNNNKFKVGAITQLQLTIIGHMTKALGGLLSDAVSHCVPGRKPDMKSHYKLNSELPEQNQT